METTTPSARVTLWSIAALLLLFGCALRIVPWTSFNGMSYDESWYRKYLLALDRDGLTAYPDICAAYLEDGKDEKTIAKVPPMRVLFVTSGWLWKRAAFGDAAPADLNAGADPGCDPALISLHRIATFFGCLGLVFAWIFARRLFSETEALAVLALSATSPLLIHTSQHAMIDGVSGACALLALWTLWESMKPDAHRAWLFAFGGSFALLVLAKESAFFPAIGCAALMLVGNRVGVGRADRRQWFAAILGGLFALAILSIAAGGFQSMLDVYLLLVRKAQSLGYAQRTGDGPWSRYFVDLMILTPAVLCCALGGGFRALRDDRRALGLLVFVVVTYIVMCNVRYGMNLRYTTIWDFPLRSLAAVQIAALVARLPHRQMFFAVAIAILCALDLAQYRQFFVSHRLYELPTEDLLRAESMLK
ncbi:MAG TPA: glycosyltransferase family 39 protein [Chthoniobacteraceae bacterium]|jgi:hypothetical protein|nr:glycosyltransferase family 39 protein [Chthoniobacteraceae bacterium]